MKNTINIKPDNFDDFTYSKISHFQTIMKHSNAVPHKWKEANKGVIDPSLFTLKIYQYLLVYTFIYDNIPKGSKT